MEKSKKDSCKQPAETSVVRDQLCPPIDHMLNRARLFDIYYRANHAEAGEEYTDDIDEQPINVIGFNEIHQSKKF